MKKSDEPTNSQIIYGYNFRIERLNLGWSQEKAANYSKTSKSFISLLERAKTGISLRKAEELSLVLFNKELIDMLRKKPRSYKRAQTEFPVGRVDPQKRKNLLNSINISALFKMR